MEGEPEAVFWSRVLFLLHIIWINHKAAICCSSAGLIPCNSVVFSKCDLTSYSMKPLSLALPMGLCRAAMLQFLLWLMMWNTSPFTSFCKIKAWMFFAYKSLLPRLEKLSENLCLQELLRITGSWEGGEARFITAFLKCSKSENTKMLKGDLFILSCFQWATWAHLVNILKETSSWNKKSFKSHDSYFP